MRNPRTQPFLLEIGCEEIPARFLPDAEQRLGGLLVQALNVGRLLPPSSSPRTYSTPRRLTVYVSDVLAQEPDQVIENVGPPVSVAFDRTGEPTRAAQAFAEKNSVRVHELKRVNRPKGEYLAFCYTVQGRPSPEFLKQLLPDVIQACTLPKSIHWVAKAGPRFVRPIRWIVALLGEGQQARVIPIEFAGVKAGDRTYGHRALGKRPITVRSFREYAKKLLAAHVEIDPAKRRERVRKECKALVEKFALTAVEDKQLEDWVVNSTEWPRALLGGFDKRYLALPREILVTVMRDHQKYFAVEGQKGNLEPRFVAILNLEGDPKGLIRAGHERVLAARFTDAEFFWNLDQRLPLDKRGEMLAGMTYQAELGSYGEKVRRMKVIASNLCSRLEGLPAESKLKAKFRPVDTAWALRAVDLCKCDLTTQMVQEFPELQGIVGGLYSQRQGESAVVADAIYDHYLPGGLEDRCPRSLIGAVVSLADKVDSVASGSAVGQEPTGSSDPFALRRKANGIIRVLLEFSLAIPLKPLLEDALNALQIQWSKPKAEVFSSLVEFLKERLRYYLETVRKLRYDTVRAVLAAGWDPPLEALQRAEALEAIREGEDFEALSVAAKRIKNILAKSARASDWIPGNVDTVLIEGGPEGGLYTAFALERDKAAQFAERGDYLRALEAISRLRPHVDRFFDKVLVMAEDPAVRQNRLRLLKRLDELFSSLAHFALIAAAPPHVDASTLKAVAPDG